MPLPDKIFLYLHGSMFLERTTFMEFSCWCVPCLQFMSQTCSLLQELEKSHSSSPCRTTHSLYKYCRENQRPRGTSQQLLIFLQWHFSLCPDEHPMSHDESPGLVLSVNMNFSSITARVLCHNIFWHMGCSGNETMMGIWEQHSPMSCCR